MKIEIRSDHVIIKGYVNTVERDSRQLPSPQGGFVEQVRSGTWGNAISRKEDIPLYLNHIKNRKLASTKEGTLKVKEDSIGLYAEARVYDKEVIESAKNNNLVGWSFGFTKLKDSWGKTDNGIDRRYLEDIDVSEISVLDNTRTPAYYGTSIENRGTDEINVEERFFSDVVETYTEEKEKENESRELDNRIKLLNLELEL